VHVCFFNRAYWPDVSATGQLLTELAEDLARDHGWQVTVVCGQPLHSGRAAPARERRQAVEIIRARGTTLDPRRFSGRAANYLTYFGSALLRGLTVARPDVVVALTDPPIIGLAGLALARRAQARFVMLCQDVFPEAAALLTDFRNAGVDAALDAITRFQLRRADAVVALGETMQQRLEGKGADPARVHVIDNWVDCSAVTPGERHTDWSDAEGFGGRFVVLHAGNLGLSQDLDTLIEAADRLRERRDILFVLRGGGVRQAELQQRVRDRGLSNVRFVPFQPREALGRWSAAADVSIVSLRRGLAGVIVPSKIYSALASGRPCIAAVEPACEVAAIVRAAECGPVIAPHDPLALVAAIEMLAGDPALAARMGRNAREAAFRFDRPRQVARYDALLRSVVAR
jgi:colanic acid biosynthesis glycosyl transferase WcaI